MRMTIKQMLAGRFIVLFVFSCFFAVIGFGQMGLFKTGELPYPSQSGLDVSKVSTSSEQFFDSLEQFAKENHLIIYRSVVENGDLKISQLEDYNSHNTERLDIEGMKKLLLKLEFVRALMQGQYIDPEA